MREDFFTIADHIQTLVQQGEVALTWFSGEQSDFVRFNRGRVRQAGSVAQRELDVDLVRGARHAEGAVVLSGIPEIDRERTSALVERLRAIVEVVPEDPHLLYAEEVHSTDRLRENRLPDAPDAVDAIVAAARDVDLVGIYAAGAIHAGFANTLGQRNWYSSSSFNLDWSLYHRADKAVKASYAGFEWNDAELATRMAQAKDQLALLSLPSRKIEPGRYRAYLTPAALMELFQLMALDAFGLKSHRTKQTSLIRLAAGEAELHPSVTLVENTREGVCPEFQSSGFIKPERVPLIERGRHAGCLASPRSSKEYGVPANGANDHESPESLDMAPGTLPRSEILAALDTGLWVSNLWYTNYSDRAACRITGMTRFATFWVERGRIAGPVDVMRFDDSLYRLLGSKLEGLTAERDFILDANTYEGRSTASMRLPGALVRDLTFTL